MNFAARITGTGSGFPKNRVSNADIVKRLAKLGIETSDTWIRERTGIRERRVSEVGNHAEHNSSLGFLAAQKALEMAGRSPEDIDQIIYATCSPDTLLPSTACWLQHKMGANKAWAMDINAACSGFIYGLATAEKFIQTGQVKTALIVGGEVLTHFSTGKTATPVFCSETGQERLLLNRSRRTQLNGFCPAICFRTEIYGSFFICRRVVQIWRLPLKDTP